MTRLARLEALLLAGLVLIVGRLAHLQGVHGARYRGLAESNRLRIVPETAPRGPILDHRGRLLAGSQTVFRLAVVPQDTNDPEALLRHVAPVVGRSPEALLRAFRKARSLAFQPASVVFPLPKPTALHLEEERWRFPGLEVDPDTTRAYPRGEAAGHVLGYLSQPTAEEFTVLREEGVRRGDLVGRTGIERWGDRTLRGRAGGRLVEVDHRARQVRVVGERPSETGTALTLTLDAELQSLLEQALGSQPGAAVVLDPADGAVRAMVSRPGFSPEAFAVSDSERIQAYLDDPRAPLMNRATLGVYQPGSIAKLIAAAAALRHGVLTPSTTIVCPGSLRVGDRTFRCWNLDGHGPLTLPEALRESCNVFFLQVGRWLGAARLREAYEQAGFGQATGWLLDEQRGHVPQRRLTEGEVAMLAIGQSELLITPLQAAVATAMFANGGWRMTPWIVEETAGQDRRHPPGRRHRPWGAEELRVVQEGMLAVVADPRGTGFRAASPTVRIAGKTGTAQTHRPGQSHAWFVGYCPVEAPRVAFAIVAEFGGSGGDLPAEIARSLCEYVAADAPPARVPEDVGRSLPPAPALPSPPHPAGEAPGSVAAEPSESPRG